MKIVLTTKENTSFKGQKDIALCDELGERLPYNQLAVSSVDSSGLITVTASFLVDGKSVIIK